MVRSPGAIGFVLVFGSSLFGAETPTTSDKVSFVRDVRPIFQQNCLGCHQPAKPLGGYLMTNREVMLKAGDSTKVGVVPGKPEVSHLFERLTTQDAKKLMPKGKPALTEREITLVKKWIAEGANDDTPATARHVIDGAHPPTYTLPPVIAALDYSPDGKILAVAGYHEVLLWTADGSKLLGRLVGMAERVQGVYFAPDGQSLAVSGGSPGRFGELQIWDVETMKLKLSHMVTYDTLFGVSWSPDGTKIAFGCTDNTLRAIDLDGKQILFQGAHNDWVLDTVFSTEGDYLVSVSRDMTIKLTEVGTQRFIDNITSITPGVLKGGVQAVARRPFKEKRMVKAANLEIADTRPKVYDELLIGGADGVPKLYKMHREVKRVIGDDANKVREFEAMPGRIFAVACAADGEHFAAGSGLYGKGEARVYNAAGKKVSTLEGQKGAVFALVFSPDGKTVASGGFDGSVRLNDAQTGKLIKEFVPVPVATR